jgi:hypothetical protein
MIWQGLKRSPQEHGRRAWARADAEQIVHDIFNSPAPPVEDLQRIGRTVAETSPLMPPLSQRRTRRVLRTTVL